jgi:hypothetical protein
VSPRALGANGGRCVAALSAVLLASCGGGGDGFVPVTPNPPPPLVINMTPSSSTVNVGASATYAVSVSGGTAPTPTLASCASSSTPIATVSVNGSSCVATGVSAGAATITATLSGGQTVSAALTVQALPPAITNFQIAPSTATVAVGQTVPLAPSINSPAGATVTVSYSSSSNAIATVSAAGVVTGVSAGAAVITATAQGTGSGFSAVSLSRTSNITVTSAASIAPLTASVGVGAQSTFTVTNPGGSSAVASCASTSTAVATVTASGSTCVATGVSAGTTTISATLASGGPSLQASLTVTAGTLCTPTTVTLPANATGNLTSTTCLITTGVPRRGSIARVTLPSASALEVRLNPTGFAPYIAAVPVGEEEFVFSSQQTATQVRRIWHLGSGQVDVLVGGLQPGALGSYQAQISTVSASITNCEAVVIAGSLTSQQALGTGDCTIAGRQADEFLVFSSRPCTITMSRGTGASPVIDPFLEAYAGTTLVFSDDDSGGGFDARLQLANCRSAAGNVLTIRATTLSQGDVGSYTLTVVFAAAGEGDATAGATVQAPLKRVPAATTTLSVPRDGRSWLEHIGVERIDARLH